MPSDANAGSIGVCVPAATSASTRWTSVSCARRRIQKRTEWSAAKKVHTAASGSAAASVLASAAAPAR